MGFNTGDTSIAAKAVKLEIDFSRTGEYVPVCCNALSEALNYTVESWSDFCSDGFMSNAVTGIDVAWSGDAIVRYGTATAEMVKNRYKVEEMNGVPVRITNTLLDETIDVKVAVTSLNLTMTAGELIKFDFELKPASGAPIQKAFPAK